MVLSEKQTLAWDILEDHQNGVRELIFGGGAGGGKSRLGVFWLAVCCLYFPGTRWLMGRAKAKTLKETTLKSFIDVMKDEGWKDLYVYNQQKGVLTFVNGSEILLKDLAYYPSDPEYDELGSLEITGAFIDEVGQITEKCWNIVRSRIRYKLQDFCQCGTPTAEQEQVEFSDPDDPDSRNKWYCESCEKVHNGLMPKIVGSCNPSRGWVYNNFFSPDRKGDIRIDRRFVQSLVTDNPFISPEYIESLRNLDRASMERLLHGNWDYSDDPSDLCSYQAIEALWTNEYVAEIERCGTYITADIALHGSDKFVIFVWYGFTIVEFRVMAKCTAPEVESMIKQLALTWKVPRHRIAYDADGLGSYLMGYMAGAIPINNGGTPLKGQSENNKNYHFKEVFKNLKSQLYFKLAALINANKIYIECDLGDYAQLVREELACIKNNSYGKDVPLHVLPKDKVKELLGRSPDFSDAMAYRLYFALKSSLSTIADRDFYSEDLSKRKLN